VKFKRIFVALMALAIVLNMVPLTAIAAGGTPTVSISSGEVQPGGEVTLTVSIEDNPGLATCMIYLYYDTDTFVVDHSEDIVGAGKFGSTGSVIGNSIAIAKTNGRYDGAAGKDGVLALWYNGSGGNTTSDGKMLTVTLRASGTAANGSYAVEVGYSDADTCNEQGDNVALKTVSGSVTVSGGKTDKPADKPAGDAGKEEAPTQFPDVSGHWAEEYIEQAAALSLVQGYPDGSYGPGRTMTRAEFVTILWRTAGSPAPGKAASFTDLTVDWYKDAIAWAEENQVVNGVGNGRFDPGGHITREQLVTTLHRMAGTPVGMEAMFYDWYDDEYTDSDRISDYARSALYWSVYNKIYCDEDAVTVGTELAPREAANRAQIAVMIVRYLDKV